MPPPPIANVAPAPPPVSHAPFAIFGRLVDEEGRVVRTLPGIGEADVAEPVGSDRYRIRGQILDAATGALAPERVPAAIATIDSQQEAYALERYRADGAPAWTVPLHGWRSLRPPELAVGGGRVVISFDHDVRAFDAQTGAPSWAANDDDGSRLEIGGDTAYYVKCNEPTHDHWLIGRALADGAERFRAALPAPCDPWIRVGDRHVIVINEGHSPTTTVFDLAGRELYRLSELVGGSLEVPHGAGSDLLLVTDQHIERIGDDGAVRWRLGRPESTFVADDDFVALPTGEVVIANYGAIDDGGIDVMRIATDDGRIAWRTHVPGLGVGHSEYFQSVYARARGAALFVISQAAGGWYMERLSLATGARERRCGAGTPACAAARR